MSNKLKPLFYLFLSILFVGFTLKYSSAQERYWVDGSGSWNDPNHWAETSGGKPGAAIPTAENDVIFDNNSFTANGQFVEIKEIVECNNFTWRVNKYNSSLKSKSFLFKSLTKAGIHVHGSALINENINNQFFGDIVLKGQGEQKLNCASALNSDIIIDAKDGEYRLVNDFTTHGNITLKSGSLYTNDKSITVNDFIAIGENNRALILGNSEVTFNSWNFKESKNLNLDAKNSTLIYTKELSKRNIDLGGLEINSFKKAGAKASVSFDAEADSVICNGTSTGRITVRILSGTANYTYKLYDDYPNIFGGTGQEVGLPIGPTNVDTAVFENLSANSKYYVLVLDGAPSNSGTTVPVYEPSKLLPGNITITKDLTCFDGSDGELTANPSGGTPPLTYQWQEDLGAGYVDITDSTRQSLTGVGQGYYQVLINDQNGCGDVSAAIIFTRQFKPSNIPDSIHISNVTTTASCPTPADNGSVTVTASGGTGIAGYYLIETSGSTRIPGAGLNATGNFTGLAPGTYETYAVDLSACEKQGPDAVVAEKDLSSDPAGINSDNDNFCPGDAANLSVQGGSLGDGATWEWYSGSCGGTSVGSGASINVSPAITTTYYVRAEGDCNTTACASLTITVKTESVAPTGATVDHNNFCPGDFANITLSYVGGILGTGATAEWYSDAGFTTNVGSGQDLTIAAPATTTTYYVRFEGDCNNTAAASVTVTVKTESTDPTGITTDNDNFCPGQSANLSVQGGSLGDGATWEWYSGSCGGVPVGSGASINVSPAITTTYYVRAEGDCNTTACASITITVKTESTDPTGITTDNDNFCPGDAANLSVQGGSLGTGATWEWYSGSCGGTSVGSGASINVSPAITTTYYVRAEGDCNTSACASLTITVKTESVAPTGATVDHNNFCPGDFANITLSYVGGTLGTGATAEWYSDAGFTTNVGSGQDLTIAAPATTTTYYVRFEGDCNNTAGASVTVTVKTESTNPTGITTDNDNFCPGDAANLSVQGGSLGTGATWEWYSGSCGGTSVGSGASINVSPAITTTYYVRAEGDCNTTACASLTITVKTESVAPTGATVDHNNFCPGDFANITLSYVGGTLGTGATAEWYSDAGFTTNVGSGQDLTIAAPATTTTYYVRFEGDCNNTAGASVTVTVKTESTDPTGITTDNDNFCPGQSANLSVQGGSLGDGATWEWYSGSCGGTSVGSGASINVSPAITTTYYVRAEGDCNTTACASITITVKTESTNPTGITTDNDNFCPGDAANLSVQGGSLGTGATWEWYSGSCGGTSVGSGASINVSPAVTTTYYVRAEGDCNTTACASITITVKTESTDPTGITTDNDNFCPGDGANLSVQGGSLGTGATWEWYSGSCGGVPVGSGASINVSPAITTTYYVRAEGDCNTTACASITITVKTESTDPTGITTDNDNFCPGDAANLSVQGGSLGTGATWEWYSGSCGGTSEGSGASINVSPAITTTYYVRAEGDCNTTACASLTITVKTESVAPTGATVDHNNFCPGDFANITLSYVGGTLGTGATAEWYSDAGFTTNVGSGQDLTIAAPATTTTYYVRFEGDCNNTAAASVTVTVKTESTDPTGITTDNDNFCPGDAANLSVQGGSLGTGATWEWYSGSCGGTSVGSGASINVSPAITTTYYVRAEGDCNTTACASLTITVKTQSTDPVGISTDNNNFCVGESANLTVQGGSLGDGSTWQWYSGSCGGTSVGSGLVISVSPITTTTYYVRAEGDCNTTACASITLTVYDSPVAFAGEDTTLCYDTPYHIQDANTTNSDGVNWEILTGNGSLDDPSILNPEYTPALSDGGTIVELVLHALGKGSCSEDTDTLRINYLNELTVSVGKPTPFFIDSSSTHIDVYMKITGHEYISLIGLYLVSPLDSIVELKPYCTSIPSGITTTTDIEYTFYNDPIDTASAGGLQPEDACSVSTGRYLFSGDWKKKLHGQDPSNGAWRVMIKDTLNYGAPGILEEATIAFTDTNDVNVLETVLYADSTINLNITGHTGSGPAAITTYTLPITGLTTSCFGLCDATAVATASGGQPPYNDIDFVWSTSIDFSVDPIFGDTVDLCAGTYYVQVTDANGCIAIDSVTVGEPAEIKITNSTVVDNVCYNDSVGEVTLEFSGGTGALTYTHDKNTGAPKASGETFSGLKADEYTFTITDASGCTKDTSITIDEGLEINVTTNVTGISCYGFADGQIEITDGLPGYLYSIDSASTWQAGNTFGPLPVDTFYIAVQDVNGCIQFGDTVEMLNPDTITITSIDVTPYSCFGNEDDGEITINATGGVGILTYSIDGTNFQTDPTFTSVAKGTYSVYVKDNCYTKTLLDTAHVTGPTPITIDIVDITDVNTCYGDNTGRIEITASGGTGNFEYSNNGGADYQSNNVFIGLQAGTYTLSVRDDDACISTDSIVTVDQPVELVINGFTVIDASECNDDLTGSVTVNASGGTGALEYNVDGGTFQSDPTFNGLSAGSHTFIVKDANSCETSDEASIVLLDPLTATFESNSVTCFGLSNGSATVNPVDGLPPYSYLWEDGEITASISSKAAGIYSVTVTDSNQPKNCQFVGTVEIEEPDELKANATPQNKKCITSPSRDLTNSMGSVIVVPTGGTPGYSYDWDGPSGFDSDNDTILHLQPGNYSVTITDSRDCKTTYSTTLIEDASYDIPSYSVEFEDNTVCWNDNVIFENTFTEDAVNSIIFQISEEVSPNQWIASNWEVNVSQSPTVVERFINYNTNFDYIRATNEYCYQDTTDILIEYLPSFQLDIIDELDGNAEDDTIYLKGARTGMLSAYVTDTVDVSFEWYESDPIFSQEFPNAAEISIEPDSSAYYVVVATSDECVDSSRVYLEFIPAITPNEAFSPNDDGVNDYWQIKFIDKFTNNKVMVFNRWGLKVFEQQRYSNEDRSRAWDGRSKNGKELPSGTYYYVIILDEAGFEPITGSITIIR